MNCDGKALTLARERDAFKAQLEQERAINRSLRKHLKRLKLVGSNIA